MSYSPAHRTFPYTIYFPKILPLKEQSPEDSIQRNKGFCSTVQMDKSPAWFWWSPRLIMLPLFKTLPGSQLPSPSEWNPRPLLWFPPHPSHTLHTITELPVFILLRPRGHAPLLTPLLFCFFCPECPSARWTHEVLPQSVYSPLMC